MPEIEDFSDITPSDTDNHGWVNLLHALNAGSIVQISCATFEYFNGVLPPHWAGRGLLNNQPGFVFCEGWDVPQWFWWEGASRPDPTTRYFARVYPSWPAIRTAVDPRIHHADYPNL